MTGILLSPKYPRGQARKCVSYPRTAPGAETAASNAGSKVPTHSPSRQAGSGRNGLWDQAPRNNPVTNRQGHAATVCLWRDKVFSKPPSSSLSHVCPPRWLCPLLPQQLQVQSNLTGRPHAEWALDQRSPRGLFWQPSVPPHLRYQQWSESSFLKSPPQLSAGVSVQEAGKTHPLGCTGDLAVLTES